MHHYILNIGLHVYALDNSRLNPAYVFDLLKSRGLEFAPEVHATYHNSATEPTLVLQCTSKGGASAKAWEWIASDLGQDCIAVYDADTDYGMLHGPKAEAWGAFNESMFIMPGGRTLDVERGNQYTLPL